MSQRPTVVKLGGDALSSPQLIAKQAARLARFAARGEPVVAVASARRGVTEHLLRLVEDVREEVTRTGAPSAFAPHEAARAVSTGELVSSSLLAFALHQLGVDAVSLDAREAGILAEGDPADARIRRVLTRKIERVLARGGIPIVAGFQGWNHGHVLTLGRGGSDTTAVAIAGALGAGRVQFVKATGGLCSGDPNLVRGVLHFPSAPHRFLTDLTAAGAKIVQPEAARLAEADGIPLEFLALCSDTAATLIGGGASAVGLRGVALCQLSETEARVTAVAGDAGAPEAVERLLPPLRALGGTLVTSRTHPQRLEFAVASEAAREALQLVHDAFVTQTADQPLLQRCGT